MGCCGNQRTELRSTGSSAARPAPALSMRPSSTQSRNRSSETIAREATAVSNRAARGTQPASTRAAVGAGSIALRYLETTRILVPGPTTGRRYEFSAAHPVQYVEFRDAQILLETRFFRRA